MSPAQTKLLLESAANLFSVTAFPWQVLSQLYWAAGSIAALLGRTQRCTLYKSPVHHSVTHTQRQTSIQTHTHTDAYSQLWSCQLNSRAQLRGEPKHLERSDNDHEVKTRSHPSIFIKIAQYFNRIEK